MRQVAEWLEKLGMSWLEPRCSGVRGRSRQRYRGERVRFCTLLAFPPVIIVPRKPVNAGSNRYGSGGCENPPRRAQSKLA